jgi:4-amino-4-deoxy-L-arabinose transferase-like glycosyltransferase
MDYRRKTATVGALALMACLVQAWTISRAVVPAQDCVRYLIVAQGFERDGFTATVRAQPEQPLYPALVWLVHRMLTDAGWITADNWAICLQVAAAIPLVLSVIPVYLLFCKLHGDRTALLATTFYCLLGGIARLGADGLSDSTHLALFCGALYFAARYFAVNRNGLIVSLGNALRGVPWVTVQGGVALHGTPQRAFPTDLPRRAFPTEHHGSPTHNNSAKWLLLCGVLTALALTARAESIVLPVAMFATLALLQVTQGRRQAWKKTLLAAATYSLGVAAVLAPYLAWCNALSPASAAARITGRGGAAEAAPLNDFNTSVRADAVEPRWELPGMGRLVFGKKDTSTSARFRGYLAATWKLLHELAQTLHYWVGALALVGLWIARRQLHSPLDRWMQCLCVALVLTGVYVAAHSGYLSTRHVLLLVLLSIGWAAAGLLAIADQIARTVNGWSLLTVTFAAIALLACGADCLAPLHASREAHRQAARWLNDNAERTVAVLDSRGWTALYTGRKTYRYEAAQAAFSDPALGYVVVEQAELSATSRRSETMRLLMNHAGERVARFAADSGKHSVVIYRWRAERFEQLGVQSYAR